MRHLIIFSFIALLLISSCKSNKESSVATQPEGRVPVTITHPGIAELTDAVELNATSTFQLKTSVKANVNGYLQEVNAQLGEKINKGKKLFVIRTKEAENLGNTLSSTDTSFHFSGLISIAAPGNGYITQLNYQTGDYVQDGETLAEISDANSLIFLLDLPYELKPCLALNKTIDLTLPDGQKLTGGLDKPLPMVDPTSQTLKYVIKAPLSVFIPENLIARVHFIQTVSKHAFTLPKEAVLSDETQSEFWVMKMINNSTAVKTVIKKGIEANGRIEMAQPKFSLSDSIILTGNYGLEDTAKVTIMQK